MSIFDNSSLVDSRLSAVETKTQGQTATSSLTTFIHPISMNGNKITNLASASNETDAVNKFYVDEAISNYLLIDDAVSTYLNKTDAGTTYATITDLNNTNTNLSTNYTNNTNLANTYLNKTDAGTTYLALSGGTMSGALTMGGQAINNAGAITGTSFKKVEVLLHNF